MLRKIAPEILIQFRLNPIIEGLNRCSFIFLCCDAVTLVLGFIIVARRSGRLLRIRPETIFGKGVTSRAQATDVHRFRFCAPIPSRCGI